MSAAIKNSLSNLNRALDRLDNALQHHEARQKEQQQELFEARSALNDNNGAPASGFSGINDRNAEQFAMRLDNAIDTVERLLREG